MGLLFSVLHWRGVWCYCSIISLKKLLRRVKETKRKRERERRGKEPWEISCPISQAPQLPCSSHSPHWLSIAGANLLGEKPHAGKKWNHLKLLDTQLPHSVFPSPPPSSSFFLHPSFFFSPLFSLPAHQRPGRETWRFAWSPLCLPTPSFCTMASLLPPLTPRLLPCANWVRERERKMVYLRDRTLGCWNDVKLSHS